MSRLFFFSLFLFFSLPAIGEASERAFAGESFDEFFASPAEGQHPKNMVRTLIALRCAEGTCQTSFRRIRIEPNPNGKNSEKSNRNFKGTIAKNDGDNLTLKGQFRYRDLGYFGEPENYYQNGNVTFEHQEDGTYSVFKELTYTFLSPNHPENTSKCIK